MAVSDREASGRREDESGSELEPAEYAWIEQQLQQLGEFTLQEEESEDEWQDPSGGPLGDAVAACEDGNVDALKESLGRLAAPITVDTPGPDGDTLLHLACLYGHDECVRALLAAGASAGSVNQQDGSTPLHDAAAGGFVECMEMLLGAGAQVDVKDGDGETALHCAARGDHAEAVKLLLQRGSDPQVASGSGSTPAQEAESAEVKQLLQHVAGEGGGADTQEAA